MAFNPPPPPPNALDSHTPYGDPFDERQQRPSYPPTMDSSSNVHLPAPMNNPAFGASDLSLASKEYDQEAEHEAADAFDESRPLTHPTHAYPPQQFVDHLHSPHSVMIISWLMTQLLAGVIRAHMGIRIHWLVPNLQTLLGPDAKPFGVERPRRLSSPMATSSTSILSLTQLRTL